MKVLQVIPAFYPAVTWGGPVQSTYELCNALVQVRDVALRVITTDTAGNSLNDRVETKSFVAEGYEVYYRRRRLATSLSPSMLWSLWPMIRWADIVHLTAAYSAPTIPTLLICKILGKPVVWSPRGAFLRWEGTSHPHAKRLWELICNALCNEKRVTLHLTSKEELNQSLVRIKRASAVAIANGVNMPRRTSTPTAKETKSLRLLYLGRLHPIKGIENLLAAIREVDSSVTLSICGDSSNSYARKLKALTEKLGVTDRVRFEGHVSDDEKMRHFANSDVFIMPSFSESFGLSAAEALSYGLPIIASKGTPWGDVEEVRCGLWVENDPESLATAISKIRQMPLAEMGERGQEWMSREFSWGKIAKQMLKVYEALIEQQH